MECVVLLKSEHPCENNTKKKTMWSALKRSLQCRPAASEVHDPRASREGPDLSAIATSRRGSRCRSGCSRSISNLRDVIHGSRRHPERPPNCSPRSIGSSEFLNPLTHEVILSSSTCEIRIRGSASGEGLQQQHQSSSVRAGSSLSIPRKSPGASSKALGSQRASSRSMAGLADSDGAAAGPLGCHKCGEQFGRWEDVEEHHVAKHAVSELTEGDSSRKIVEIICKASWIKTETHVARIERVLKVHNTQKMLARFEEYREMVKLRASKLPKKHPRCLADGNELLRFHGAALACSLGMNGTSNLCNLQRCGVCSTIRNGFSMPRNAVGVFTASTSGKALEFVGICKEEAEESESAPLRKALLVCRVIAGRVHRPLENLHEIEGQTGFDSLAGKVGLYANIEELYLLNPRALLPCFVVICRS